MSKLQPLWRRAHYAVLLAPAFLGGCYVVPIVPVPRPYYRPHPHYRGDYRVGEVQQQPSIEASVAVNGGMGSGPL